jgi:hypothetical protein
MLLRNFGTYLPDRHNPEDYNMNPNLSVSHSASRELHISAPEQQLHVCHVHNTALHTNFRNGTKKFPFNDLF